MQGAPVWGATVSRRGAQGGIMPPESWGEEGVRTALRIAWDALHGLGTQEHERAWTTSVMLCVQRAITCSEAKRLGKGFMGAAPILSGAPQHRQLYARGRCTIEVQE